MELSYMELREEICDICHKMWQLGWVAANDGNVSVKLPDGTFLATPTRFAFLSAGIGFWLWLMRRIIKSYVDIIGRSRPINSTSGADKIKKRG